MPIDGKYPIGVFGNNQSAVVETEHTDDVTVLFGTVPDFRFIDFFGEVLPDHCRKLDPHANIYLIIGKRYLVPFAPVGEEQAASPSNRKNNPVGSTGLLPILIGKLDCVGVLVYIGDTGAGQQGHLIPQRIDQMHHCIKVGVGPQVLELRLAHVKVKLQAAFFQFIIGHEPFGGRPKADQDAVRLLNIVDHRCIRQKFGQPAAIFRADDIFSIRKCTRTCKALHNGAGFAFDAGGHLLCDNRADTAL